MQYDGPAEMQEDAREQIVQLLPRLRRFCLGLTGSHVAADDLLQATCERALSRLHQWKPNTKLDSWLFTIARSQWINDWRRRQTRGTEVDIEQLDLPQLNDRGTDAENSVLLTQVMSCLMALPDEQKELMLLICVEEFSYNDAAEILGIQVGTVMSRLARARRKLRGFAANNTGTEMKEHGHAP